MGNNRLVMWLGCLKVWETDRRRLRERRWEVEDGTSAKFGWVLFALIILFGFYLVFKFTIK